MAKLNVERTPLEGAWVIDPNPYKDDRGQMARTFCKQELAAHGIEFRIVQTNASINIHAGTLRGLHCQVEPMAKAKIIRCVRGKLFDVIVDMRPGSPTFLQHHAIELSAENMKMVIIPEGFYHGFLTLEDFTEMDYMVNNFYTPEYSRGLRYDDPALGINWPRQVKCISEQDKNWPLLEGITT